MAIKDSVFNLVLKAKNLLSGETEKAADGLDQLSNSVKQYGDNVSNLKQAIKLENQLKRLEERSQSAADSVEQLSASYEQSAKELGIADEAVSRLNSRLADAQKEQKRLQDEMGKTGPTDKLLAAYRQATNQVDLYEETLSRARVEQGQWARTVQQAGTRLDRAKTSQEKYAGQLADTGKKLSDLKRSAGLADQGVEQLERGLESASADLQRAKNDLKAANAEAAGAGRAMAQAGASAESAGSRFSRFGTGLVSTLGNASALVVGIGTGIAGWQITQKFKAAVQSGISFEQQMLNVAAAGNATEAELARLTVAAEKMGANTKYSATEAGAALETLVRAGYDTANAIALLPAVLQTATAAKTDLATAAGLVSDQLSIFNRDASRATETTDVLSKGASLANTSILQIAEAMKTAGGQAVAYGYDLETTTAYIDILAKRAIRGGEAGTALRNILGQLGDPSSKAREELEKLGITSGNLTDVIAGLEKAGSDGEAAIQAFGLEAGPALRALISGGAAEVERLTAALKDSAGSTEAAAKRMGDSTQGAIKSLLSALDAAGRKLAQPMLGVISSEAKLLAQDLRDLAAGNDLDQLGSKISEITQKITSSFRGWFKDIDYSTVTAALDSVSSGVDSVISGLKSGATFIKEWSSELILLGQALALLKLSQLASGLAGALAGFVGLKRSTVEAGGAAAETAGRFSGLLAVLSKIPAKIPIAIAVTGVTALVAAGNKIGELSAKYGEAGAVAERSKARMNTTAMEYVKSAQKLIEANSQFADFERLSSERLAEMTAQELASYKERLAGAERYYRAKDLQNKALEQMGLQDQFDTDAQGIADALSAIAAANKAIADSQTAAGEAVKSMGYIAEDARGRILGMGASMDDLKRRFPDAKVKAIQVGVGFGVLAKDAKGAAGALDQQAKAAKDATEANAALVKSTGGDRQSRQSQIETKIAFKAQIDKGKTLDDFRLLEQQLSDALGEQTISLSAYQELSPKIQQQLAALRQEASGLKKDLADGLGSAKVDVEIDRPQVEPITVPVNADTAAVSQQLQAMSADYSAYMISAENVVHANRMAKLREYQDTMSRLSAAGADELANEALKKGKRL